MKDYCRMCAQAHIDDRKEDPDFDDILSVPLKLFDAYLDLRIDEHGYLVLALDTPSNVKNLSRKRVKFCPICGRKITTPTPSDISSNRLEVR